MSSSGSLKVSFLVLWFTISDFSSKREMKPCSPPVKAFFTAPVLAGIFFASSEGGALPVCPVGVSPPLRKR
jgi:hypothetical protein